jgi:hypothetical protein
MDVQWPVVAQESAVGVKRHRGVSVATMTKQCSDPFCHSEKGSMLIPAFGPPLGPIQYAGSMMDILSGVEAAKSPQTSVFMSQGFRAWCPVVNEDRLVGIEDSLYVIENNDPYKDMFTRPIPGAMQIAAKCWVVMEFPAARLSDPGLPTIKEEPAAEGEETPEDVDRCFSVGSDPVSPWAGSGPASELESSVGYCAESSDGESSFARDADESGDESKSFPSPNVVGRGILERDDDDTL